MVKKQLHVKNMYIKQKLSLKSNYAPNLSQHNQIITNI